jgi:oligopeptide/dipeptide ABC transporter ATP-binding protein
VVRNSQSAPLLEVNDLTIAYPGASAPLRVVRDVSFHIAAGEVLALVGETGCGKTTLALSLLGLLNPRARILAGLVRFDGTPLHGNEESLRGGSIGLVFQEPRAALNPVLTIGTHLIETIRAHKAVPLKEARSRGAAALTDAGIADSFSQMKRYPFEMSGGMCQRVGIALALCNGPRLLVADEPTSALDPTIQWQIVALLKALNERRGLAILLISHDLAMVAEAADRVAVMYHGRLVELGPAEVIVSRPAHPYTRALLRSVPGLKHHRERAPVQSIGGSLPGPAQEYAGCAFAPRCAEAEACCFEEIPPAVQVSPDHRAACLRADRA